MKFINNSTHRRCISLAGIVFFLPLVYFLNLTPHAAQTSVLTAPGTYTFSIGLEQVGTANATIDVSNINQGYVMCRYAGKADGADVVVSKSEYGNNYQQRINNDGTYNAIPILDGNGSYIVRIWEQPNGTSYCMAAGIDVDVTLDNETLPFLYPNRVVNNSPDSFAVAKSWELTRDLETDPEKISAVFTYIVDNIVYDGVKAATVEPGYVSDPDKTIADKKGICVDYAVLAAVMLRSQGIPTRVEYGYMGDGTYHAWISVYSGQSGIVNGLIDIQKNSWTLLDPTFASSDGAYTAALLSSAKVNGDYIAIYVY